MVITKLTGGLGNQLFQYASSRALALYQNTELILDISSFYQEELPELEVPRAFEISHFRGIVEKTITQKDYETNEQYKKFTSSVIEKLLPRHKRKIYKEPHFHYDKNFFQSRKDVLLKGVWQSEKYFSKYQSELREILQLKEDTIINVKSKGEELHKENSVSIHVRRGDYLRLPIILEWHGVLDVEHYNNAIELLQSKANKPLKLYYFSDDPQWVEENLCTIWPGEVISKNSQNTGLEDFFLMSQCKHNIIANSSFSWWAAWLNNNPEKIVIAPKKWFGNAPNDTKDLIPESWIKI